MYFVFEESEGYEMSGCFVGLEVDIRDRFFWVLPRWFCDILVFCYAKWEKKGLVTFYDLILLNVTTKVTTKV